MTTVPTLQQILNQKQTYSELSEEPSFTLTDILEEPLDEELIQDVEIDEENMDQFFEDQIDEEEQSEILTQSKVYQFPSLQEQQNTQKEQPSKAQASQSELASPVSVNPKNIQSSQSKIRASKVTGSKISSQSEIQEIAPHQRLRKMPLLPMEQVENMSFVKLKNVTNLFEDPNNTSIGIPTCISATGNRFLAVGTSMGNIVLFQIGVKGNKVLGSVQQRKFGYVSSLSISRDNKYLVAGHESGLVTLWDLYYFTLLKQQINSRSKILQVLFCSQTSQNFISNDAQGNTYIYTIEKYIWLNLKSQKLLQKSPSLFYDIRFHELQTKNSLVALCTLEYILLISIKPTINIIGKIVRPDGINLNHLPNVQMGRCVIEGLGYRGDVKPMYDVLLVSWGKNLYVYRFMPSATSFGAIQQLFMYKHPSVIYNIEYLSENIFVTLDKHQVFTTIRIDVSLPSALQSLQQVEHRRHPELHQEIVSSDSITINMPSSSSKQPAVTCSVIHSMEMQEEVIYQRFIKTKEQNYIKSFRNTVINCTFNSEQKQIFFITKNCVFRARLHKWTTFLSSMVNEQKNIKMAMKLAIQLKNQHLNIFSEKVQVTGKKAQKSISMFCEIGRIFVEEGLKDVKQNNIQRAKNRERAEMEVKEIAQQLKQLYEYTIEYFIELKCEKFLFQTIYSKIIRNLPSFEYWELFIESLKPFILAQKLTRIPSIQVFKQILDYYSEKKSNSPEQDNMKLIDKMIINLESESLHYENAVSILADNKLYKGLAYMCSVNKDFVSPCNKLLMRMIEASDNKLENAEREFFGILDLYLTKLINGFYINDKKIPSRIYQTHVLKDISLWLSFQDTLAYFLKGSDSQGDKAEFNSLSFTFQKLLQWLYKLLEMSAKQKEKGNFHELVNHLMQALDSVENREMMKKSSESSSKRENINFLRYQLSLLLVKYGKDVDLYEPELTFYVNIQYSYNVKQLRTSISSIQFIAIELAQELTFMKKYFEVLHLIKIEGNLDEQKTPYQQICSTQSDWCKYLYNFLVASLKSKIQQKKDHLQTQNNIEQPQQNNIDFSNKQQSSKSVNEEIQIRSQQQKERSARGSQTSVKSTQIIENNELIRSLFSPGSNPLIQSPFESSSSLKRRDQMCQKIQSLDLQPLAVSSEMSQPDQKTLHSIQFYNNSYTLVDFILSNFQFEQIDQFIESLIKLNSELVIVYILEHYELEVVDKKIEAIKDEEVKYFVVRRILRMMRRIKREKTLFSSPKKPQNPSSNPRKVWGNEYRSYTKKQQSLLHTAQHKTSLILSKLSSSTLSQPILLFYLSQLSKYKPQKRVYSQLKHNITEYQLFIDRVLEMMKLYKLNSCIGLIYEHMGELDNAFQMYRLVYNERMEVNVRKLVMVQHCHGRFLRQIFNQMLNICQRINTNQEWMKLLQAVLEPLTQDNKFSRKKKEQVIELIQKVYTANPNHAFIQEFGEVIENTLLEVSSHIPVEQISSVFSQYSELMNKTFMLNCLKSTMHTYSKSIFIYETSNAMVINDQANQFQKIYHQNKIKGLNCMPICQNCEGLIELKDRMVVYKCSHMYHRKCMLPDQEKCKKCMMIEVGETESTEHSSFDLEILKNKKKQESSLKLIESNPRIDMNHMHEEEELSLRITQEEKQTLKTNTIYRCLAFDDFLQKDEMKFDQFRRDYDAYLGKYE